MLAIKACTEEYKRMPHQNRCTPTKRLEQQKVLPFHPLNLYSIMNNKNRFTVDKTIKCKPEMNNKQGVFLHGD